MRIAIMSPHTCKNGNTTLAILLGLQLSSTGNKTCIGHVMPTSRSIIKYLSLSEFEDKTSTPSQIVKILRDGGISQEEISDYCRKVNEDLEVFTNTSSNFDQTDMNFMHTYMAKSFPHENVIFDVDDNDLKQTKSIIGMCDVVVLNITQSVTELNDFKDKKDEYIALIKDKPIVVVVNKYNSVKSTIVATANCMGIKKPSNWLVLHENPWITWATNTGKINMLFKKILSKDSRVIELHYDLAKIQTGIAKAKSIHDKKAKVK